MWVAQQRAQELRKTFGLFRSDEWLRFAHRLGMRVCLADLPDGFPGFTNGDTIYVCRSLNWTSRASVVWHEIGHVVMHAGDADWWRSRPQGEITVSKMERQAWEFAFLYPVWE